MIFNSHSNLVGQHAFLSASKYSWLNYSDAALENAYNRFCAVQRGSELHDLAKRCIKLDIRLPNTKQALNMYVNDAIGFRMTPEQVLFYSYNCYGTADTISFRDNFLRIHDLKTGDNPTKMDQLEIYAALFCLEYQHDPHDISMELRIYQSGNVVVHNPDPDRIADIMNKIVTFDRKLNELRQEE